MLKQTERLLRARTIAPTCDGSFDVWFLPLVLESLEPIQLHVLEWLIFDADDVAAPPALCTIELCNYISSTPQRIGAALSDLRRLGLVTTEHRIDTHGRNAYHTAVEWVRVARAQMELTR